MNNSVILSAYAFQRHYLKLLVEDIAEERMTAQPGGIVNHPAWQLGHLVVVQDRLVRMLGGNSKIEADWETRYGRGSVPSPDRSAHPSKADFLRTLDERRGEYVRLFGSVSSDDLAKPPPGGKIPQAFTSMGMFLLFIMTTHEGTHLGQLAAWRKAIGLPQALSKLE